MIHKIALLALIGSLITPANAARAESVFKPDDLLAICGDSITEQRIYSVYIEDYLLMCQPTNGVKAMMCGWSGASASSSAGHMKGDVVTLRPNVVTLYYGMNDGGYNEPNETAENSYRTGLSKLIADFKAGGSRTIIVGSAGIVDSYYFKNPHHKEVSAKDYNETLRRLAEIGKSVAVSNDVLFADLHTPMMDAMAKAKAAYGETYAVEGEAEGIHAGPPGHLLMAYALLKAMGFDGNIGTITFDMNTNAATATGEQRIVSSAPGQIVIESHRYPFCFFSGAKDSDKADAATQAENFNYGNAAILPFVPFNQELNRYMLIVHNLKSPKAKITWGEESKEFTAEQLAAGINLAAEFQRGPFVKPFFEVHRAVQAQQAYESMFIRGYLSDLEHQLSQELPEKKSSITAVEQNMKDIESVFFDRSSKAVKPVTHTIKIEQLN
jgi:lysophospholipase L1-like esterase